MPHADKAVSALVYSGSATPVVASKEDCQSVRQQAKVMVHSPSALYMCNCFYKMLLLRSVCNEQRKQMIRLCRTQLRGRSVGRHRRARVDDFYRIYFCKTQLFSSLQVIISIGVYMYMYMAEFYY